MNSAGSALAENEKYLDSIEGRVSKFRASWQSLSADFFNGDFIKGVVSGADTIVSGLDSIIAKFGAIPTLIGTVTAAMSGWRISQGQRTGIIDFIANPEAGRSHVRILNNDMKELGATIKDVYQSYYNPGENAGRMGKAFAGAKAGLKGTFGMIGASIVSNSSEIKEYRQLVKSWEEANKTYHDFKEREGNKPFKNGTASADGMEAKKNVEQAREALVSYNKELAAGSSLWGKYVNEMDSAGKVGQATFKGYIGWLKESNKLGQAVGQTVTKGIFNFGSMLASGFAGFGVSAIISLAIGGITKLINAQNELRESARNTALEYQQSQKSIGDYTAEVDSIETNLSSGTLSIDETIAARQRLAQIQSELVSQYGSEAAGLNLVGASAEQAAAAMEHLAQVQADRFLNDPENQKGFKQAVDDMEKVQSHLVHDIKDADPAQIKQIKELTEGFDAITLGEIGKDRYDIKIKADTRDGLKQIDEFISEAEARGIDLSNVFASNGNSIYSDLLRIRKQYAEIEAASGESYDAQSDAAIKSTKDFIKIQDQINEAKSNYDKALLGTYDNDGERAKAVQDAIKGLRDVQDVVNKTDFTGAKGVGDSFREQINSAIDGIGEEELKADVELNLKTDSLDKDVPEKLQSVLDIIDKFKTDTGEINVSDILNAQGADPSTWNALAAAADNYGVSVENLLQILANAGAIQLDTNKLTFDASERLKELSTSATSVAEQQDALSAAMKEQASNGAISAATYDALVKTSGDYANMLERTADGMKVNEDAAQQLVNAKAMELSAEMRLERKKASDRYDENAKSIEELLAIQERLRASGRELSDEQQADLTRWQSENSQIQSAINQYDMLIGKMQQLTSAYGKWQLAQETSNQDAMYNSFQTAQKQIEEGIKTGKVGTDDYISAVRMLVPDNVDPSDVNAVQTYMKKLGRYLTFDKEGNPLRTGMENFLKDASSAKLDGGPLMEQLADGTYKILDGISASDFVERLKITPSMAKAIFENLEAYGFHFEYDADDFFNLEQIETAKQDIDDINAKFKEIADNTDYTSEGRQNAISQLAKDNKASIESYVSAYKAAVEEMNQYQPGTESFNNAKENAQQLFDLIDSLPPEILMELGIDTDKLDDLLDPERMAEPVKVDADTTEAESKVEHVGETYNTTKDGIESSPINTPSPDMSGTEEGVEEPERRYMAMKERMESESIHPPGVDTSGTEVNLEVPERRYMAAKEKIESDSIHLPAPDTEAVNAGIEGAERRYLAAKERIEAASIHPPSTDKGAADATDKDIKVNVDANTDAAKAKIEALSGTPVKVPIEADPTGIQNAVQSGANGPIRVDVDANVTMAKQQIASLNNMVINVDVQARVANAQNQINAMTGPQIDSTNVSVNYTPNLNALPESFNPITRMVNYIAQLAALPSSLPAITRIVNYVPRGDTGGGHSVNGTANVSGTAHASGTANASGNWGTAPGGTTLVGELGEELVVDVNSGRWYTVGTNGAEFTNIAPGSIVFNHKQTEALFKYGKVAGRGHALLSGTAMISGGGGFVGGGSGGSSGTGQKKKQQQERQQQQQRQRQRKQPIVTTTAEVEVDVRLNDKDLEEKLKDELSKMSENLEYILGQYEHEIFLIEKNAINGFTEEDTRNVISIYRKMMDEVHAQADAARAKGLSDNSKTVMELSKRWFELRDNIKDAINDYYESLISKTSNSIKLLDFQMGELQNKVRNRWVKNPNDAWVFSDSGSNYDDILGKMNEVIEKQREIQAAAHDGADEMRALGFEDSSDEITKYKDEWADASDAIVEAITTAYDAITGDLENRITLTENWLDNAVKAGDVDKVRKYSDDIYDYYTQMQTAIHDEADRLRALGYSDTSEEVSKLSDLWWDYEEKRKTAAFNAWKEIVDTAKDATDELAGMYDTLKQAAKEYANMGGYLTLDTLEKLLAMEPKYMQMLRDENGLWVIDEENVKKATAAKMEDLAITNALAYVDRLRLALLGQSNEKLDELLWVTQDTADSTWQLVYAQLAALDLTDDQYDAALHNINVIRSMAHAAIEGIGKESDEYKKSLDDMKDGLDDLIKYVMDMLKHKIDEQVDSLEDMKDQYKEIIDEKKKSLDLTKKENDYQKSLSKKVKELAKIQAQIESLRFDTSREAQAKIAKLQQDRADIEEEIAEAQADKAREITEEALDDNLKAYEDEKDDEIDVLKKSVSSQQKLYDQALEYMRTHWDTLYGELIAWNTEYGSVLNSEIDEAWANASKAVERYGGVLEAVKATTEELKNLTESIDFNAVGRSDNADYDAEGRAYKNNSNAGLGSSPAILPPGSGLNQTTSQAEIVGGAILDAAYKMKANSAEYMRVGGGSMANATPEQQSLMRENEGYADEIGSLMGTKLTRGNDGVWRLPDGKNLYDIIPAVPTKNYLIDLGKKYGKFHSGGIAGGDSTLKQDEMFALLQKGEAIFTKEQQNSLMRILDFSKAIAGKFDSLAMSGANFLTGQLKDLTQSSMTPAYAGPSNVSYDINVPVQIFPAQKMDEGEIKSLTSKISDYTIKTINSDMSRRGIRGGTKRF